jgi:hypothetical protein
MGQFFSALNPINSNGKFACSLPKVDAQIQMDFPVEFVPMTKHSVDIMAAGSAMDAAASSNGGCFHRSPPPGFIRLSKIILPPSSSTFLIPPNPPSNHYYLKFLPISVFAVMLYINASVSLKYSTV